MSHQSVPRCATVTWRANFAEWIDPVPLFNTVTAAEPVLVALRSADWICCRLALGRSFPLAVQGSSMKFAEEILRVGTHTVLKEIQAIVSSRRETRKWLFSQLQTFSIGGHRDV